MRAKAIVVTVLLVSCALLVGCSSFEPVEIHYGEDQCDYCRMAIADAAFGSQLITSTGKAHKFDSIECLAAFESTKAVDPSEIGARWVTDVKQPGSFLSVEKAIIVQSDGLRSPMGLGLAAVVSPELARTFSTEVSGQTMAWPEVKDYVRKSWNLNP